MLTTGSVNRLRNKATPPVVVLIYHRVTELASDPQLLAVSPERFRSHLNILKKYPILRFEDDWSDVREPSVAVTFDDGYADNQCEALPILTDMAVPATFFITAGSVGSRREFWWDDLERLILVPPVLPEEFRVAPPVVAKPMKWFTRTNRERWKLYADMHSLIAQSHDADLCRRLIDILQSWSGLGADGRESHRSMNRNELAALAASPFVTVGAHGMTHLPFSRLSSTRQEEELVSSKQLLETWLERKVDVFSYPFGRKCDYSSESVRLVERAGFIKAAANFPGQWRRSTPPFEVPRQVVRNWSAKEFEKKLNEFWVL